MTQDAGWWELCIHCAPALEDLVFWRLENLGCRGAASDRVGDQIRLRGYLHHEQFNPVELKSLEADVCRDAQTFDLPLPQLTSRVIQAEDWAHAWKQYWHPQEVGDRLLINPAWLPIPDASQTQRFVLRLDPGVAFGTGAHPTTQLCLEALEQYVTSGAVIADVGCGSGILAIAATLFGAAQVYGVDLDPWAVQSTQDNWELNQLPPETCWVKQGSVAQLPTIVGFDGIVCNILAPVIIELMPELSAIAQPQTWLLLSGLLVTQAPDVIHAAQHHGWTLTEQWEQRDWACLGLHRI
jgi:ribosomal protein L11 methyltransferase